MAGIVGSAFRVGLNLYHIGTIGNILYQNTPRFWKRAITNRKNFKSIMKEIKTIGTHDGMFHCDEVLGCAMLKIMFPNAKIIRSREQEVLDKCDIVIDVGGEYDPARFKFDHHQRGFEETASSVLPGKEWTMKLSSAGLVYCHFGKDVLRCVTDLEDEKILDEIFDKIYEGFIQEIDGIDNGVPMCCETTKYTISTGLSSRVRHLNKSWNESVFDETKAFETAMILVGGEFTDRVINLVKRWLPAREIVKAAIDKRYDVDKSGEIIELSTPCPWKEHFFKLEKELNLTPSIKFAIFKDNKSWRTQAVSLDEHSFILRVPLLEEWRGLRERDIKGVDDAIFVHHAGFIGGAQSRNGALQMALKTLASSS